MVAAATAPRRCGRGSACARLRLRGLRGPPAALGSGGRTPGAAAAAGHRKTLAGNLAVSAGDRDSVESSRGLGRPEGFRYVLSLFSRRFCGHVKSDLRLSPSLP